MEVIYFPLISFGSKEHSVSFIIPSSEHTMNLTNVNKNDDDKNKASFTLPRNLTPHRRTRELA